MSYSQKSLSFCMVLILFLWGWGATLFGQSKLDVMDKITEISGLERQILDLDAILKETLTRNIKGYQGGLSSFQKYSIKDIMLSNFSAADLLKVTKIGLTRKMTSTHLMNIHKFFDRDLIIRFSEAESRANTIKGKRRQRNFEIAMKFRKPDETRLKQIRELDRLLHLTDNATALSMEIISVTLRVLNRLTDGDLTDREINIILDKNREQIRKRAQRAVTNHALYTYRKFTNKEFWAYTRAIRNNWSVRRMYYLHEMIQKRYLRYWADLCDRHYNYH